MATPAVAADAAAAAAPIVVTDEEERAAYRNFSNSAHQARVEKLYHEKYTKQTVAYNQARIAEYGANFGVDVERGGRGKMTMWEALELLNSVVDDSDPDTAQPQILHALQTAEACRAAFPDKPWMALVGLIHDAGKFLAHPRFGLQQWELVGDTFPVGCAVSDANVLSHFWAEGNPDAQDPRYNTPLGVYAPHCGFDAVLWAFGHDEYFYQVLKNHKACTLPEEALFIIRHHSFYPWHNRGGYAELASEKDVSMLKIVQAFQKCDLYSKVDTNALDVEKLRPYYQSLIDQYVPGVIDF